MTICDLSSFHCYILMIIIILMQSLRYATPRTYQPTYQLTKLSFESLVWLFYLLIMVQWNDDSNACFAPLSYVDI